MTTSNIAWRLACTVISCTAAFPQWAALGPFGGSASIVVTDPHSSRTVIAGTQNGLLFRSTDSGSSWTPLPFPAQLRAILHTLAIDPQTPGIYLAGVSSDVPEYSGILRSTDSGATWHQVPALRNRQVRAIAFWRGNSQVIVAGTEIGVFQSRDGGLNWRCICPADDAQVQPIVSLAIDPNDSDIIYAGTPHLPWRTTDGGATWSSIHTGILDDSDVFSIQVDRNRPSRLFASTCSGIYRSLNAGATWTRLKSAKDASDRTYTIVQDPQYESVWFAGTTYGMMRSPDGGNTWEMINRRNTHAIAFDMGRLGRIFAATEQGIWRSDDGGRSWLEANHGFCSRSLEGLFAGLDGALYTSTVADPGESRLFRLPLGANEWRLVQTSDSRADREATRQSSGASEPPLHVEEPQRVQEREESIDIDGETIQAVSRHPSDPQWVMAAKFGAVFESQDGGRSWMKISPDSWPVTSVRKLLVMPESPRRLFVLTPQQGVFALTLHSNLVARVAGK